jgi:hypothetical protein
MIIFVKNYRTNGIRGAMGIVQIPNYLGVLSDRMLIFAIFVK